MVFVAFSMLLYQNNHIRQKMTALPFRKNGVIPMVHRSDEDWNNPSATTKKCSFLSLRKSFLVYLLFSNKELRIDLPLVECHSFTFISSLKEPLSMKNIRTQTFSKHFEKPSGTICISLYSEFKTSGFKTFTADNQVYPVQPGPAEDSLQTMWASELCNISRLNSS